MSNDNDAKQPNQHDKWDRYDDSLDSGGGPAGALNARAAARTKAVCKETRLERRARVTADDATRILQELVHGATTVGKLRAAAEVSHKRFHAAIKSLGDSVIRQTDPDDRRCRLYALRGDR